MVRKIYLFIFLAALFCAKSFCNTNPSSKDMHSPESPATLPHHKYPSRQFENFRGRRKPLRQGSCRLNRINVIPVSEAGKEFVAVELFFSQSIDPRSVRHENILVNSSAIKPWQKILFNKSSTCMRIFLEKQQSFSLSVEGIRSYNASPVPKAQIESMECGHKYFFDKEEKAWKKF